VLTANFAGCEEIETPVEIEELQRAMLFGEKPSDSKKNILQFYISLAGLTLTILALIIILIVHLKIKRFVASMSEHSDIKKGQETNEEDYEDPTALNHTYSEVL
jgi:hypothetical protein